MERFEGRVALVTGASSGIGRAIATKLVQAGMKVVGCARRVERLQEVTERLREYKGEFHPIQCDIASESAVRSMFETINRDHGGLDVCVNNAGLLLPSTIVEGGYTDWTTMCQVNILGPLLCGQLAVQSMRSKGADAGSIVFISSDFGTHVPDHQPGFHFYSVTKHATHAGTVALRQELRAAKSHIRVMEVCPGLVNTGEAVDRALGKDVAAKILKAFTPLEPDNVADAVLYILSAPPLVEMNHLSVKSTEQPK